MPVEDALPGVGLLPPRLDILLRALRAPHARQVLIRGWGSPCANEDHLMADWVDGVYQNRQLLLRVCQLCEAVEVRDRTVTVTPVVGSKMVNKPDALLGWYTGARKSQRVYK